jgi:hypothetical protein
MTAALFDEAAQTDLTCTLTRLVPHVTYGLNHICGWWVSVSLTLAIMTFANETLLEGITETFANETLLERFNVCR